MPRSNNNNQSQNNRKGRVQAVGHEIPLSSMAKHKNDFVLELLNGDIITGIMHGFDRWTISVLLPGRTVPSTYFKHGILSFTVYEGV